MARQTTAQGRRMLWGGILVLAALSAWRLGGGSTARTRARFEGASMGTTWTVKLGRHAPATDAEAVQAAIEATLSRVDRRLSTYREESDVRRLSRAGAGEAVQVSTDAIQVLTRAREISVWTGGAFDVTVAPLVRAWGFGAGASALPQPPDEAALTKLRGRVGYSKLQVDAPAKTVTKTQADVEVDLSAIAKGYAVDEVARVLEARGFVDYLVEVGGELRVRGERAPGERWRLAIEQPDAEGRAVHRAFELPDGGALATSGDYRTYYESGGARVSHTVDPRSGRSIETQVASASVLSNDCATADALATAMGVLGADEGLALADREGWAVYLLVRTERGLLPRASRAFKVRTGATESP